jgi:hypothetical protein
MVIIYWLSCADRCECCFQVMTSIVVKSDPSLLTSELVTRIMVGVAQQAVEKIDRMRAHAGKVFMSLLHRLVINELYVHT